jgi:hypothetical protein
MPEILPLRNKCVIMEYAMNIAPTEDSNAVKAMKKMK